MTDPTPATAAPQYAFSSGNSGPFLTVWQIRRLSDGQVLASGRTFGRRHEQRAWERIQRVAKECGYV